MKLFPLLASGCCHLHGMLESMIATYRTVIEESLSYWRPQKREGSNSLIPESLYKPTHDFTTIRLGWAYKRPYCVPLFVGLSGNCRWEQSLLSDILCGQIYTVLTYFPFFTAIALYSSLCLYHQASPYSFKYLFTKFEKSCEIGSFPLTEIVWLEQMVKGF